MGLGWRVGPYSQKTATRREPYGARGFSQAYEIECMVSHPFRKSAKRMGHPEFVGTLGPEFVGTLGSKRLRAGRVS
jgi:hypothetical protein